MRQPSLYIPHGGGPCFFMDDPRGTWTGMAAFLRELPALLPERPKAILICSGHWETKGFAFTGGANPELIFDYHGFPPHTYELTYPAPGDPVLAAKAEGLLITAGVTATLDVTRGLDHGVFVPLKVAFPDAGVPVVEMSTDAKLDPAEHLAAGRALAPLRDEGVLIVGAGMSFHNMRGYGRTSSTGRSHEFDAWLSGAATAEAPARSAALTRWAEAPSGRFAHPREEHLLPLMVAAGASKAAGERVYNELVMETAISGFRFA